MNLILPKHKPYAFILFSILLVTFIFIQGCAEAPEEQSPPTTSPKEQSPPATSPKDSFLTAHVRTQYSPYEEIAISVDSASTAQAADEALFEAQGYAQGSHHFIQMDLLRKTAAGRLSELFGDRALYHTSALAVLVGKKTGDALTVYDQDHIWWLLGLPFSIEKNPFKKSNPNLLIDT